MTHSPTKLVETSETIETTPQAITNDDFLRAVFGVPGPEASPVVTSFKGDPNKQKGWPARQWVPGQAFGSNDANNYFSLASFRPDDAGQYRRRKENFAALHAVMLDDVGGKVPVDRLTLPPSWQIETSPGNFQWGYLLREPLADPAAADRLVAAIIEAGLTDPGAGGPQARNARLPVAVNGKHAPPFPCRLVEWAPTRKYSPDEIYAGLQIEPLLPVRLQPKGAKLKATRDDDDPVLIPRPGENTVLVALRERGLYKQPLGSNTHDMTCPWVREHTGGIDSGTAYFEPGDSWPIGGFKCQHGHCAGRRIRDLLAYLDVEINAARMKPTIRVAQGEIHRIVDAAECELAKGGRHYQRGGLIVTVQTDPGTLETKIQDITQQALVRALAGVALWVRFDERSKLWARIDPPARHAGVLFDSTEYPHLPVLFGLARQPYLRADGSLVAAPDFDTATGMFGVFNAREFKVPDKPTRADAEAALVVLKELLTEFCFATDSDKAATLAAMLTAVLRPSLPHAPMFHVRAHMVGSGKSYLCELISAFASAQRGAPSTFPGDDDECRKLLLAELLRAPAVIEFDNLTSDLLPHKSLCTALTSEHMTGRILGVSKTATVSTRTLFLSSGNNVDPIHDMTRRCLTIRLAPLCETPAVRSFSRPELVREVLRDRGRYVSAALTIVRAWIVAGRFKLDCKPLAGFGDWSDLCRQPLLWLGCADPAAIIFETIATDPDRQLLSRFLHAWHVAFGQVEVRVNDLVKRAETFGDENTELREVLQEIAEERGAINRRKLGWWIKRHAGRPVDGRRIVPGLGGQTAARWRVDLVDTMVSMVSPVPSDGVAETVTGFAPLFASGGGK